MILLETVLYEFGFDWSKAIGQCPILLIGICFFFGSRMIQTSSDTQGINDKRINPQAVKHILRAIGIFSCIVFAVFFSAHVSEYYEYGAIMKSGDYLTVEGTVENYDPLLWHEKDAERFEINGVCFEYSDAGTNGYQATAERGGVVTGNGQRLKVKYITNESGENIILYIAQIK